MDSAFADYVALRMAQPRFVNARSVGSAIELWLRQARLVTAGGVIARDDLIEITARRRPRQPGLQDLRRPWLPGPPQPRRAVTCSRGSALIWAWVNRSVTHCLRENSTVWSLKCGESGLADWE
jgi:hypothetical protein